MSMTTTSRLLLVFAVLVGVLGTIAASQATMGVALVGFACLLGICARVIQARDHQRELRATRDTHSVRVA